MISSLQEVCPTSTQCFHCRRCSSHDDTGKETNSSSSSSSSVQDHRHIYCIWLWNCNCELLSFHVVVGFDVDFLSFHSFSNFSSNCLTEYYPISWPTLLVLLPSLVLVFVFLLLRNTNRKSACRFCCFWKKLQQKLNMQISLLLENVTETQVCRSYYFWKMQQKLSMQILLLVVENATEFLSMHIFVASGNGN